MKSIRNFISLFSKLRQGENFEIHQMIVEYLSSVITTFTSLLELFNVYLAKVDKLDELFKRFRSYRESGQLRIIHKNRKDSFLGIKQRVKSATYLHDPVESEVGNRLLFLFDNFKDATKKPYTESSAYYSEFIEKARSDEYKDDFELLNLEAGIDELERFNLAFKELYKIRSDKMEFRELQGDIRVARREADMAFRDLSDGINSLYGAYELANNDPDKYALLSAMIDQINGFILQYKDGYYRHVETRKPGDAENPNKPLTPTKKTYDFEMDTESVERDQVVVITDKNPEAFRTFIKNQTFTGSVICYDETESGGGLVPDDLTFDDFAKDAEEQPNGFRFITDKDILEDGGSLVNNAVLCLEDKVLVRFDTFRKPDYID